jgi:hypothetical protein
MSILGILPFFILDLFDNSLFTPVFKINNATD